MGLCARGLRAGSPDRSGLGRRGCVWVHMLGMGRLGRAEASVWLKVGIPGLALGIKAGQGHLPRGVGAEAEGA